MRSSDLDESIETTGVEADAALADAPRDSPVTVATPVKPHTPQKPIAWLVLSLALPVVVEQFLHSIVGTNDTWLATHLVRHATDEAGRATNAAAGAAVGAVQYILWMVGLVSGAIGTGATAIIARALGARDPRTADTICGQAVMLALVAGFGLAALMYVAGPFFASAAQLHPDATRYFIDYLRLLAFAMPLTLLMFAAGACLRGAGDTLTPAIAMVIVDVVNIFFTVGLTWGWFGLPTMGFDGIALGTVIAYATGGLLLLVILFRRRGFMRLHASQLRPHWEPLKRILRIGLPSGTESGLQWFANFAVLSGVNKLGDAAATAHMAAIRIESYSFLTGMGFATAAATLVGQSLGMGDARRARRCAYWAYAMGGGFMTLMGVLFVIFGHPIASLMSDDPAVVDGVAGAVRTTGCIQSGFAAAMIFGFALRGAGDTFKVMLFNLSSIFLIRFAGVLAVVWWLGGGLQAVWYVLCGELMLRGILMFLRFKFGRWELAKV